MNKTICCALVSFLWGSVVQVAARYEEGEPLNQRPLVGKHFSEEAHRCYESGTLVEHQIICSSYSSSIE